MLRDKRKMTSRCFLWSSAGENVAWLYCYLRGQDWNTLNNLNMWRANSCWMWLRFVLKRKTYWEVVYMWGHFVGVISFILMFSEVTSAIIFEKRNLGNKLRDARNNFTDMHLIQFLILWVVTSTKWL